jgi:hypothetical protein
MKIRINADGSVLLIHQTATVHAIARALDGTVTTKRASHVEPVEPHQPTKTPKKLPSWNVDLRPVKGPGTLNTMFATREEALRAEVHWIETNILSASAKH